jgi:hypothetical protein
MHSWDSSIEVDAIKPIVTNQAGRFEAKEKEFKRLIVLESTFQRCSR